MIEDNVTYTLLDRALSRFLIERSQLEGEQREQLNRILLRLSSQMGSGDSCTPLNRQECELLQGTELLNEEGVAPLVVEDNHLYLYRYWAYETRLASQIKALVQSSSNSDSDSNNAILQRYFENGDIQNGQIDWQREAAARALSNSLTIITGGPGTGKTTTVVKIVAMLQERAHSQGKPLNIALAAPTGKAAMRLQQSITGAVGSLPCEAVISEAIPTKVHTIHRLLGAKRHSPYFHHRANNPLPYDLVVVDEASMVDLALMSKLVDALKDGSKLILLGDKNQLASVESGAVLADLIEALPQQTAELKQSFRFDTNIKLISDGVNQQQGANVWDSLQQKSYPNIALLDSQPASVTERLFEKSQNYWEQIKARASFTEIMAAFNQFQCLATNRVGSLGVVQINARLEERLTNAGLIEQGQSGHWYHGRPIIVNQNIPELGLFNGDIGITLTTSDGNLRVCFDGFEGSDNSNNLEVTRDFIPTRISHCETAYAMTVHKSQGSEFDEVLVVFPVLMNPVLTKELVYTAITRAKQGVELAVTEEIWLATVNQKIERHSGLVEKLRR